jgi:hypothetical protein
MKRMTVSWVVLLAVGALSAAATVRIAGGGTDGATPAAAGRPVRTAGQPRYPSAAEFARVFVGTTNQFAMEHGDSKRISHADCVQASPGHYMCSYVVMRRRGAPRECFLMQARWTPEKASTITVTLAGRVRRCGSLQEALDSLE